MSIDPWEDPAIFDGFLDGRPEETPAEEDWNDDVHDQHVSDGDYDEQIAQWRSDGVDEDSIRAWAGSRYKPPVNLETKAYLTVEEQRRLAYLRKANGYWKDYDYGH